MMNDEKQPYGFTPCPECGGQRVVAQCAPTMGVYIQRRWFSSVSPLMASVCTHCGYTMLYATQPDKVNPEKE